MILFTLPKKLKSSHSLHSLHHIAPSTSWGGKRCAQKLSKTVNVFNKKPGNSPGAYENITSPYH